MKIVTTLSDENENVLARIETSSLEAHEEEMSKIQHAVDNLIDGEIVDSQLAE